MAMATMPVYKKSGRDRETWRVVVWSRNRPQEWIVHGSKSEAEAFEARKRLEIQTRGPLEVRAAPSFAEFCSAKYNPHAAAHLRPSTWAVRQYRLITLADHFGETRLTQFTTEAVEDFKRARTEEGMRPSSINSELVALQAVLAFARKLRYPCASPDVIHLPTRGPGRIKAWTKQQVELLYAACVPEILPLVVFLANTGCRKGEALALRWDRVDLKRKFVTIEPNEEWQPKDNEPREIPLSGRLLKLLTQISRQERRGDFVFPTQFGKRFKTWPRVKWDTAVEKAGLSGGPHQLRHSYASAFLQRVPDLFLLSKILGHSTQRTTILYAHLLPDHLSKARGAVDL